jgi:hypothetical protein
MDLRIRPVIFGSNDFHLFSFRSSEHPSASMETWLKSKRFSISRSRFFILFQLAIRLELNEFKLKEMKVHDQSRSNTLFYDFGKYRTCLRNHFSSKKSFLKWLDRSAIGKFEIIEMIVARKETNKYFFILISVLKWLWLALRISRNENAKPIKISRRVWNSSREIGNFSRKSRSIFRHQSSFLKDEILNRNLSPTFHFKLKIDMKLRLESEIDDLKVQKRRKLVDSKNPKTEHEGSKMLVSSLEVEVAESKINF